MPIRIGGICQKKSFCFTTCHNHGVGRSFFQFGTKYTYRTLKGTIISREKSETIYIAEPTGRIYATSLCQNDNHINCISILY